jgi:hypothetical protein
MTSSVSKLETAEEEAFHVLLGHQAGDQGLGDRPRPCFLHVSDHGLATGEMRSWLAMLMEWPLVA